MSTILLLMTFVNVGFSLAFGDLCLICNCVFVNITRVEPKPGDFVAFQYKTDALEPFNDNTTYGSVQKYFYVNCSSENNVGQIKNLNWPKLKVLGVLANFQSSKWKKLESFPGIIRQQMIVLSLSNNLITEIEDFELDDFVRLKMLNLSQNQIQTIKKGIFGKLSLLKIVDLSNNWLTKLDDWAFYGTDLQFLNLSKNGITHITSDVFRGLNNLTVLDLSENRLTKVSEEFGNFFPSLTWLSLRKNHFQRLPELPKDLKQFDMSQNHLNDLHLAHLKLEFLDIRNNELLSMKHTNLPFLKVLKAGHNNMTEISELQSNQIEVLDLSYNKFDKIPEIITSDKLPLLQELYLDGNFIVNLTFPHASEPFSELRVLSLSRLKYVKKILKNSFQGVLPKTKKKCSAGGGLLLNLSHNSIKFIDEEAFKMMSVCQIDLSSNHLKSLSKDLLPWLKMSYVNLQDNPWQCDCNLQWMLDDFLTFMYENYPRLLFGMRCSTPFRYKNKMFVFWYNKSENVFCNSGPSGFYLDLAGNKTVEIWTVSAITCVFLGCIILIIGIVIIVLVCTRPSKRKKRQGPVKNLKNKGPPYYKHIKSSASQEVKEYTEKYV